MIVLNAVLFQIAWLTTVLCAAAGRSWPGLAVAVVVASWRVARVTERPRVARFLLASVLFGIGVDSTLMAFGVVAYPADVAKLAPGLAPAWIPGLWLAFATTFGASMRWLRGRPWLAAVAGLIAGPASYLAGERLGAMALGTSRVASLAVLGVTWAVVLPLMQAAWERWGASS